MRRFIFIAILLLAWLSTQPASIDVSQALADIGSAVASADIGSAVTSADIGSAVASSVITIAPPYQDQNSQTITLKNPTFQELKDFILSDPTSRNKYVLNQYECRHFATDVNNNAEAEGLRSAFVLIGYDRGQHAVVAFVTSDRGLVYIEPQTNARIQPKVGGRYQGREIKEILIAW